MNRDLYAYTQDYINRWVISYADFVTMLLALFIVLYALSQMDINHLKQFAGSVGNAFEVSPKINFQEENKNMLREKQRLIRIFSTTGVKVRVTDIDTSSRKNEMNELKSQIDNLETKLNKENVEFQNLEKVVQGKFGTANEIYTKREARGLIIRLKETVLFDPGSDIIKDKARMTLDKIAEVLRGVPNSLRIEGHTDGEPINTRQFPSNWELSTARATNVVKYLIDNHKFNPKRLSVVGYGEYMPLKDSSNGASNRRVDIVVLSSTSKIFEPEKMR